MKRILVLLASLVITIYEKIFRKVNIAISLHHIIGLIIRNSTGRIYIGKKLSVRTHVIFNVTASGVLEVGNNVFINDSTE